MVVFPFFLMGGDFLLENQYILLGHFFFLSKLRRKVQTYVSISKFTLKSTPTPVIFFFQYIYLSILF